MVNICLSFFTLEDVMDKLNTKHWFPMVENHDEHYEEYIESMIRRVDVPIKAVLGKSNFGKRFPESAGWRLYPTGFQSGYRDGSVCGQY